MCISAAEAIFANTTVAAWSKTIAGVLYHFMGYQNTVANDATGGNAMILPILAKPGTLDKSCLVDTRSGKNILKDMAAAIRPQTRSMSRSLGMVSFGIPSVQIFEFDVFTAVLADNALLIPAVLDEVPANRRPPLKPELFADFEGRYKSPVLVLCFDNKDAAEAAPIVVKYQPRDPDHLFIPAMDAHDGNPPVDGGMVDTDHAFLASVEGMPKGKDVIYKNFVQMSDELRILLPARVYGQELRPEPFGKPMRIPQGDVIAKVSDLASGNLDINKAIFHDGRFEYVK